MLSALQPCTASAAVAPLDAARPSLPLTGSILPACPLSAGWKILWMTNTVTKSLLNTPVVC